MEFIWDRTLHSYSEDRLSKEGEERRHGRDQGGYQVILPSPTLRKVQSKSEKLICLFWLRRTLNRMTSRGRTRVSEHKV